MDKLQTPVSDDDHILGLEDAHVTVVQYGDYECPDCHRANRTMRELARPIENKIRFVFRHFPLMNIHPRALRAAEAAEAAAAQGNFWEMHEQLFINPHKLEDKHLHGYAKSIGLDVKRFEKEMEEKIYAGKIFKAYQQGLISGVTGTPTFYINDVRYNDANFERMVDYIKSLIQA